MTRGMTRLMQEPAIVEMRSGDVQAVIDALPSDVFLLAELHPLVVAGGFIRCVTDGSRPRDVDVFTPSLYVAWAAASMLALGRGTRPDYRAPGGRVLRLSGSDLGYFVTHIDGQPPVQIIHPPGRDHPWGRSRTETLQRALLPAAGVAVDWIEGPLVGAFDLTMTAAAVSFDSAGGRWIGRQHPQFEEDVRERRLVPLSTHTPASTLRRVADFVQRGWELTPAMLDALSSGLSNDATKEQQKVLAFLRASLKGGTPTLDVAVSRQIRPVRQRRMTVREWSVSEHDAVPLELWWLQAAAPGGEFDVAGVDLGALSVRAGWGVLAWWMEFVRPMVGAQGPVTVTGSAAAAFSGNVPLETWDQLVDWFRLVRQLDAGVAELPEAGSPRWTDLARRVPVVAEILSAVGVHQVYAASRHNPGNVLAAQTRVAGMLWDLWVASAPQWPLRVLPVAVSRDHAEEWEARAGGLSLDLLVEAELAPVSAWLARQRATGEDWFRAMVWREVRRAVACRLPRENEGSD